MHSILDPETIVMETANLISDSNLSTVAVSETTESGNFSQSESLASTATKYDPVLQNNTVNDTSVVTVLVGTGVAILIVLTAIVAVVTLVLIYLRKSFQPKPKSHSTLVLKFCFGQ